MRIEAHVLRHVPRLQSMLPVVQLGAIPDPVWLSNGWRICGEYSFTSQKLTVSDRLSESCEPATCACYAAYCNLVT